MKRNIYVALWGLALSTLVLGCGLLTEDFRKVDGTTDADSDTDSDTDTDTDGDSDTNEPEECTDTSCSPDATCTVEEDAIVCTCNEGFEGDGLTCTVNCTQAGPQPIDTIGGDAKDIIVQGQVAYVLLGAGGLYTFDVSTPTAPVFLGRTGPFHAGMSMVKEGNTIFVADGMGGLVIIDVSDSTAPAVLSRLPSHGVAIEVAKNGDYVYVVNRDGPVQSVDVAVLTSPSVVSETYTNANPDASVRILGATFDGTTLYAIDTFGGLHLFNTSSYQIYWDEVIDTGTNTNSVHIDGSNLYLTGYGGLYVLDLADLSIAPTKIGTYLDIRGAWFSGANAFILGRSLFDDPHSFYALDASWWPAFPEEGSTPIARESRAIAVSGSTAFVASGGSGGFQTIELSDLTNLSPEAYPLPGNSREILVRGDFGFVADGYGGLKVISLSDPTAPAFHLPTDSPAHNLAIQGDFLYLLCDYETLIVDITDPQSPSVRSVVPESASSIAVDGDTVFLQTGSSTIHAYDVSDKDAPDLIGGAAQSFTSMGRFGGIRGDHLVTLTSSGIQMLNISDPAQITSERNMLLTSPPGSIVLSGNRVFTNHTAWGYDGSGFTILDITDILNPTEETFVPMSTGGTGLAATDEMLYFLAGGVQAMDVSNIDDIGPMGVVYEEPDQYDGYQIISTVTLAGDTAYIPANSAGIQIMDISQPLHPTIVDTYKTHLYVHDAVVRDGIAYVADQSGLEILDAAEGLFSPISFSVSANQLEYIALNEDFAFLSQGMDGVGIYDISDPSADIVPYLFDPGDYNFEGVTIRNDIAYAAVGDNGFLILDVADASSPGILGEAAPTNSYSQDVRVQGSIAYVLDSYRGLVTYDISNPADPAYSASYSPVQDMVAVEVTPEYVFAAAFYSGVQIFEVTDLYNPVAELPIPAQVNDLAIAGDRMYVATDTGVVIADITSPLAPIHLLTIPVNGNGLTVDDGIVYVDNPQAGLTSVDPRNCTEMQ